MLGERLRLMCREGGPVGSKHFITEQVFIKSIALPVLCILLIAKPISFLAKEREGRAQISFVNSAFYDGRSREPRRGQSSRGREAKTIHSTRKPSGTGGPQVGQLPTP